MTFLVLLLCRACSSYTRVVAAGEACPMSADHAHVSMDDERVKTWWASHHDPEMEVIAAVSTI